MLASSPTASSLRLLLPGRSRNSVASTNDKPLMAFTHVSASVYLRIYLAPGVVSTCNHSVTSARATVTVNTSPLVRLVSVTSLAGP